MNLGKAIKLCRTQRGMNQKQLAEKAEISVSYLSLLEKGKRDLNYSTLQNISNGLNVPISIISFLAADDQELSGINQTMREKLSALSLELLAKP